MLVAPLALEAVPRLAVASTCPWPQCWGCSCLTGPQCTTNCCRRRMIAASMHPSPALQKYRVIVIEQYHMINTFPLEILVPQRLGMMDGQASPWHFPPSSTLLSCDIFLWRHIWQIFGEEEQKWTYILVKGKKQLLFKLRSSREEHLCLVRILMSGWLWLPFLM